MARARDPRYSLQRWRRARAGWLEDHPLCANCQRYRRTTKATLVDHVVAVANGGPFWDPANWQSLCRKCHAVKTAFDVRGEAMPLICIHGYETVDCDRCGAGA